MCLVLWIPLVKFKQGVCSPSSVMGSFFFPFLTSVSILITFRRELEKLKKDLEEEKLLRSNLEVMVSTGVCRLCSGIWCHRKILTNLFSLFVLLFYIVIEWMLHEAFRHTEKIQDQLSFSGILFVKISVEVGVGVQFSAVGFCSFLEICPAGQIPGETVLSIYKIERPI